MLSGHESNLRVCMFLTGTETEYEIQPFVNYFSVCRPLCWIWYHKNVNVSDTVIITAQGRDRVHSERSAGGWDGLSKRHRVNDRRYIFLFRFAWL